MGLSNVAFARRCSTNSLQVKGAQIHVPRLRNSERQAKSRLDVLMCTHEFGPHHAIYSVSCLVQGQTGCFSFSSQTLRPIDVAHGLPAGEKTGAANRIRTCDPIITNDVLYRLSYCGTFSMWAGPRLALPGGAKAGA